MRCLISFSLVESPVVAVAGAHGNRFAFLLYRAISSFDWESHLDFCFDVRDECLVEVCDKGDCFSVLSCSSCPADPVHVIFGVAWHVVIDDLCDVIDVDASGS